MKNYCLLILLLLFMNTSFAQNYVVDGGFESYNVCPSNMGMFENAIHWTNPAPAETPDYYNECANDIISNVGVPSNVSGYQAPHGGHAYAGIIMLMPGSDYREYIEGTLYHPLVAGQCYHFEMFISQSDIYSLSTDDIAVSFFNTQINDFPGLIMPLVPTVSNADGVYPDTLNWLRVSGDFVATGGEQYFIIGNFKSTANTTYINTGGFSAANHVFIDDVSLVPCQPSSCANSSITDTTVCYATLPFLWNGNICHYAGTYDAVLTNQAGCDSAALLNLSVTPSHSITNTSICFYNLPYTWNGNTYNSFGTYNVILPGVNGGCDSVATLVLTSLPSPSSGPAGGIYASICSSELPYVLYGNSYTTTGWYHISVPAPPPAVCDSSLWLFLDILPQPSSTTNIAICSSQLPYTWNGINYIAAGTYTNTLTGSNGCDSIATLNLSVTTDPGINLGNDTTLCIGKSLTIDAAVAGASYLWQDGSMSAHYNITKPGTYWVTLSINTCNNADTIMVDFKDCDCVPSIPNAFTPNGDGINDQWIISHQYCQVPFIVTVYNRYGTLVYHSDNYQDQWKGTYKSQTCPDGTYYYVIRLVYPGKKEQVFKGNVSILR